MCLSNNNDDDLSEISELDLKTEEELKEEEVIKLVKRGRGRPKTRIEKPKEIKEKKTNIIIDAEYHRNYYHNVLSKKIVACDYCGRVVLKAKLSVHHRSLYCTNIRNWCNNINTLD